jgi:hypothetical protein
MPKLFLFDIAQMTSQYIGSLQMISKFLTIQDNLYFSKITYSGPEGCKMLS